MKIHAFRLKPGDDLRKGIDAYVKNSGIMAGTILTCVGNIKKAILRMPDAKVIKTFEDQNGYEIISLVGTLEFGNSHLHLAISDIQGSTIGGHLKEGTIVGVTAEIVIGEIPNMRFTREHDEETGYEELVIEGDVE